MRQRPLCSLLAGRYPTVKSTGIDFSPESVDYARRRNRKAIAHGRVEILQADVAELPFADRTFSAATAIRTHYFWPDFGAAFAEIYRVLRPGGRFYLLSETYKIEYHMAECRTEQALLSMLADAGFCGVRVLHRGSCLCAVAQR